MLPSGPNNASIKPTPERRSNNGHPFCTQLEDREEPRHTTSHRREDATLLNATLANHPTRRAPFILSMAPFVVWSRLMFLQRLLDTTLQSAQVWQACCASLSCRFADTK